jgi:hypothetical protein
MAIENFSWVLEGKLAGMAEPTGLRWGPEESILTDLRELFRRGVRCLLSAKPMEPGFGRLCQTAALKWIYYPIDNFSIPEDPLKFHDIVTEALEEVQRGNPVCVHCYAGIGRTGMVLSCLAGRYLHMKPDKAIRLVRSARESFDTDEQVLFAREYLMTVGG